MEIHWNTSNAARGFYRAFRLIQGDGSGTDSDPPEFAGAASQALAALAFESLARDRFLEEWLPLAARGVAPRNAIAVALAKSIPGAAAGPMPADGPAGRLAPFFLALDGIVRRQADAEMDDALAARARDIWTPHGPALLHRLAQITEPDLLADRAEVHCVRARADGGGGAAFWNHNLVFWEVDEHPPDAAGRVPDDVLTLAWLLASLQQDLPRFVENLEPPDRRQVPRLALVPALLAARPADEPGTQEELHSFLTTRRLASDQAEGIARVLDRWWRTYAARRPTWSIALAALAASLEGL